MMRRREFLAVSGAGFAQTLLGCAGTGRIGGDLSFPSFGMGALYQQLLAQNDVSVESLLARQQRGRTEVGAALESIGGVPDRHGIHHPGSAAGLIRACTVSYVSSGSRFFQSPSSLGAMKLAAEFLLRMQHADGTIDLLTTNFHSPPDTGFVLEWVCLAAALLRGANRRELDPLLADLDKFILGGAAALTIGGIHTPNHRWVVCMALARAHRLHPNPKYIQRIDEWLGEGIDIDGDGQFTERSTTVYSPLTDRCLITIARLLDRPELLEPVRRNLEMTMFYVHADGEVVTEASRRQDRNVKGSLAPYYYPYRYMALSDGNRRFGAMTRWIESSSAERLTRDLAFLVESPDIGGRLPADTALPTDYAKHFAHSKLVRIRRDRISATILADSPIFFSVHHGSAAVALRFASAFFGKGQFTGQNLSEDGGSWVMTQNLEGPYYQPLPEARRTGVDDWNKTDRASRTRSEVQRSSSVVRVMESMGGFEIDIEITGVERVPVAIELAFRAGGRLEGEGLTALADRSDAFLLKSGTGTYRFGEDSIEFGPGGCDHRWTDLRGALPKLSAQCVYLTGFTPFRRRIRLA